MLEGELPALDVASALSLLGDAVDHAVLQALAGSGLRKSHGYVVQRLLVAPATATEIAVALGVSQQAVSKSLQELVDLGHVEHLTDARDRRRRPVRLTPAGHRAVARARTTRAAFDARLRDAMGGERVEALQVLLQFALEALGLDGDVGRRAVPPPGGTLSG